MKDNFKLDNKVKTLLLLLSISLVFNLILMAYNVKSRRNLNLLINSTEKENKDLTYEIANLNNNNEKLFEKYYSDKLKKVMNDEDLTVLSQKQWNYNLTVNGDEIKNDIIYLKDRSLKIVLAETHNKDKLLPDDILAKGNITGGDLSDSIDSNINIVTTAEYEKKIDKEDIGNRVIYEFNNIPHGTIISLNLSEILTYRLNLNDKIKNNIVELIYN